MVAFGRPIDPRLAIRLAVEPWAKFGRLIGLADIECTLIPGRFVPVVEILLGDWVERSDGRHEVLDTDVSGDSALEGGRWWTRSSVTLGGLRILCILMGRDCLCSASFEDVSEGIPRDESVVTGGFPNVGGLCSLLRDGVNLDGSTMGGNACRG